MRNNCDKTFQIHRTVPGSKVLGLNAHLVLALIPIYRQGNLGIKKQITVSGRQEQNLEVL